MSNAGVSNAETNQRESLVAQATGYFSASVGELKKVSTPTRQETIQATIVTLVIMIVVALCLFVLDMVFGRIMTAVL